MFATLLGALPRPDSAGDDPARAIEIAVRAQEAAGLEPITDGRLTDGWRADNALTDGRRADGRLSPARTLAKRRALASADLDDTVWRWRATAGLTDRAVKQALPGPAALSGDHGAIDALAAVVNALGKAGCPLVEIEETELGRLADEEARGRFRDGHERLLGGVGSQEGARGPHLTLSIVGGAPPESAWPTVLALGYASLAVDLIAGSDSWNLVTRWPGDRGVIVGAESGSEQDEPKEVLLWGVRYAASSRGRGLARVGIGSAGSWANLTWAAAVRKMRILGETARLAVMPPGPELAASVDPRSVSARAAGLGTTARPARKPRAR